ncbi:hypothetical protein ES705_28574 [subsurface metagenome]
MKSEKKRSKKSLAVVLTAIMVLSVCAAGIVPVSANVASVTRDLPVSVGTDEEFDVTLTQSGFLFDQGKVVETLPEGFVYVDGSYTGGKPEWVDWDPITRNLTVWFWVDTSVTYRVTASSDEQTAVFLGRYAAVVSLDPFIFEEDDVGGDPEVGVDGTPPYTDGHNPVKGATGVPVDTNIVVHVKDNYVVDPNSIVMTVQFSSVTPTKTIQGLNHWLVTYNPPVDFGSEEVVTVTIDASDAAGNAMPQDFYSFTTEGEGDTEPPVITNVASSSITTDSATITWNTDENSDSLVKYGIASGVYTMEGYDAAGVTAHSIDLTGLSADTTYYYVVNSTDPSDNSAESGEYSFTTEAEEKPDLIVTAISPNCGYLFANESNNISATIKNNGTAIAGAFDVRFAVDDGYSVKVRIAGLTAGESEEVTVTDTTIRNADESVTITVIADCDGEVSESNEENNETVQAETVVNNGYKSKSFAGLPSLVLHEHAKFNGSIVYTVGNSSKVELAPAGTNTTGFDITIPGGATVRTARLYVYWYDSYYSAVHGDAVLEVTFDGLPFTTPDASYTDGKGFGSYNYPKGSYAYDVTSAVSSGTGTYIATIENTAANTNTVLTGQLLLVVYEDATKPEMEYWITEGCDLLKADSNYCVSPEEAIANVTFAGTIGDVANKSASLITVVAQGNEAGTDLSFNAQLWEDVWQIPAGSSMIDIDNRDVIDYLLGNDNVVDFRDTGTQGMQASNAILVVEMKPEDIVEPPIVTNPDADPYIIPEDTDNEPLWGELSNLSVGVTDDSAIVSVTINLSSIGGSAVQAMTPTGDNVWYYETNASIDSAIFEGANGGYVAHPLQVNATDEHGYSNMLVSIELMVMKNGDVSMDGVADPWDCTYLARYIAGIPGYQKLK